MGKNRPNTLIQRYYKGGSPLIMHAMLTKRAIVTLKEEINL